MIGAQLDYPQNFSPKGLHKLRYGTLKFAFGRTEIKIYAYIYIYIIHIYIYIIHIYIYIYIDLPKTKKFGVWEGRPDFSFLFKSCEIDRSQGRLV